MAIPHNIEKSAFRKGEYVGYGGGRVWRITRVGRDGWKARTQDDGQPMRCEVAHTLVALGKLIEKPWYLGNPPW